MGTNLAQFTAPAGSILVKFQGALLLEEFLPAVLKRARAEIIGWLAGSQTEGQAAEGVDVE